MPKLNVAPTKSNYLTLSRQLQFARDGFDLLEQKRQILVFELMSRLGRARDVERRVAESLGPAFAALRQSTLDAGADALDRAALAVKMDHAVTSEDQNVIGMRIPKVTLRSQGAGPHFGVGGTTAHADAAVRLFAEALPLVAELAELENAVLRLARELRKTQRRCNALSRIFIPEYSETIGYITSSLEEREREAFVIMRMIKQRLAVQDGSEECVNE
ncbi:MAG: V-type ATP synthase subunit D [Kiritimatiellae bacterium]|nr:V-type ATP synthase subunit D [Kiritimatiellia bacterium]